MQIYGVLTWMAQHRGLQVQRIWLGWRQRLITLHLVKINLTSVLPFKVNFVGAVCLHYFIFAVCFNFKSLVSGGCAPYGKLYAAI